MERNARKGSIVMEPAERWTAQHASELYDVASWGKGYFSVDGSGHLRVHPDKEPLRSIDLKQLVDPSFTDSTVARLGEYKLG